jgi:uncharacterized protein (UPF0335 family)
MAPPRPIRLNGWRGEGSERMTGPGRELGSALSDLRSSLEACHGRRRFRPPDILNATAQGQLKSIIERIERLEQEKAEIAEQIKEVFAEAKGNGFDVKILRKVVRIRKQDRAKRQEEEAILDLYLSAIGEI